MDNFTDVNAPKSRSRRVRILIYSNIALFGLTILLNIWTIQSLHPCGKTNQFQVNRDQHQQKLIDHYPLTRSASYSPMRYDAELGEPSIFKGPPRKELDDAWSKLVDQPMILVDQHTLNSFDPTTKPTKDITRKFIWRDHYQHVDTFQDPPEMVWEHVDHCIDLLRQVLMCNSAIGLIFYTDVGNKQPVARVSTTHMCRNFSEITQWVNRHDAELGGFAESIRK